MTKYGQVVIILDQLMAKLDQLINSLSQLLIGLYELMSSLTSYSPRKHTVNATANDWMQLLNQHLTSDIIMNHYCLKM